MKLRVSHNLKGLDELLGRPNHNRRGAAILDEVFDPPKSGEQR